MQQTILWITVTVIRIVVDGDEKQGLASGLQYLLCKKMKKRKKQWKRKDR